MCYDWLLVELQHKINKIEDEDVNYQENKKWIKYRKHQEDIYDVIRKNNEMEVEHERSF